MKKLMHLYLNTTYPKAYVYKCKFGCLIYNMDETTYCRLKDNSNFHINRVPTMNKLMDLFCCNENVAQYVYGNWFESLPTYVMGKNTTNEDVLVPLETEYNLTAI